MISKVGQKSAALLASTNLNMICMIDNMVELAIRSCCHKVSLIIHVSCHLNQSDRCWDDCLEDGVLLISTSPQSWRSKCDLISSVNCSLYIIALECIPITQSWIPKVIRKSPIRHLEKGLGCKTTICLWGQGFSFSKICQIFNSDDTSRIAYSSNKVWADIHLFQARLCKD